jgi:hypothetical protein
MPLENRTFWTCFGFFTTWSGWEADSRKLFASEVVYPACAALLLDAIPTL